MLRKTTIARCGRCVRWCKTIAKRGCAWFAAAVEDQNLSPRDMALPSSRRG